MLARDLPFKQIFSSVIKPVVSEEKDRLLAIASMQELSTFVPNIDIARNIDLLPVAFDACVVNRGNKNGDLIDTDTALATYKTFIHKFIDTEHNRQKVIGVILTASLTEFGTNRILREEDVRGKDNPFNITLGGVLWKAVNGDLCDLVEESNDPTSEHYMKVSASWELGFSGFKVIELAQGSKNLSEGVVVHDPEFIQNVQKYLKCFGGSGVKDGKSYYRMPNENVIAMGIGLTEKPAAEVQGVAVKLDEPIPVAPALAEENLDNNTAEAEIISQTQENNVKRERITIMKINSIADITDENLKQCTASVIAEFIQTELKKANDVFVAEKTQQANAHENLQKTTEALNKTVQEMQASLESLKKEKESREKVDSFNSRMGEVYASYELPEDVVKIVADDLKSIASDEAFASWKTKAETLLKPYSKTAIAAEKKAKEDKCAEEAEAAKKAEEAKAAEEADKKAKEDKEKKDAKPADKDCKASTEAVASAVETALDNAAETKGGLPNSSSVSAPGMKEKYATAFASENFVIKIN